MKTIFINQEFNEFKKNAWMYSFMDLLLLLICFFIMIFAATKHLNKDSEKVMESLKDKFSANSYDSEMSGLHIIYDVLSSNISQKSWHNTIEILKFEDKVSLIIPDDFFLQDDKLTEEADLFTDILSNSLFNITKNKIEIEHQINIDDLLSPEKSSDSIDRISDAYYFATQIQRFFHQKGLNKSLSIRNRFQSIGLKSIIVINIYSEKINL